MLSALGTQSGQRFFSEFTFSREPKVYIFKTFTKDMVSGNINGMVDTTAATTNSVASTGPIVRLGPNEVSVTDLNAVKAIYGAKPIFQKSMFYRRIATTGQQSLFTTVDAEFHHRHRRLLAGPLSESALKSTIPQVDALAKLAIQRMGEEMKSREASDVFKWWRFMTTDVIGELTFGASFRMLERGHVSCDASTSLRKLPVTNGRQ